MQQQPRIHKTATPPELRAVARHGQKRPSLAGIRRRVTDAAAQGLLRARERHDRTGRWGLDGPAIEPLRESMDIYETVLGASSVMQMEQAQTVRLASLKAQIGVAA